MDILVAQFYAHILKSIKKFLMTIKQSKLFHATIKLIQ